MSSPEPRLGLPDLIVAGADDLRAVMDRMTRNRLGVAFVCGPGGHLEGVVSDGDLRRALVDGAVLGAPVGRVANADPLTAATRDEARALARRPGVVAVPVVDGTNTVVEVVLADRDAVVGPELAPPPAGRSGARVLALVPARGGSRRLPRKNLALLGGRSLVGWAVAAGLDAGSVDRVVVSTDDAEIAREAERQGADVPWLRPAALSGDDVTTAEVVAHALAWAADALDPSPEVVVLLEPTAPLRPAGLVDSVVAALRAAPDAASALTVAAVPHTLHPDEQLVLGDDGLVPFGGGSLEARRGRAAQVPTFIPTGQVYATRVRAAAGGRGVLVGPAVPVVRPWSEVLDIDDAEDLRAATRRWSDLGLAAEAEPEVEPEGDR